MNFPLPTILPFACWLLTLAIAPLVFPHFWEKNKNKAICSFLVSLPILIYFFSNGLGNEILKSMEEYISFILLLGSLYVASGGILLLGDIEGTPKTNVSFLAIGAVLANIIGTTGASMILIRPLLRINSERKNTAHIPLFFIFIVSNLGGCLTPLGDPPLFLGYLHGVPFLWTLRLFPMWAVAVGLVLAMFYCMDSFHYKREASADLEQDKTKLEPISLEGRVNLAFLVGIVAAVIFPSPFRELIMLIMGALSMHFTHAETRKSNGFTWSPIIEVAILFAAIFVTMVPALKILEHEGPSLGITKPWQFFWLAGSLSSFLDNAPTYLTFLALAQGAVPAPGEAARIPAVFLTAISLGSVFMGANTYIGNGPNFMVKAIAEEAGYKMPSFFGYMAYSIVILIPVFLIITYLFLL